jgi:hypothetical protein
VRANHWHRTDWHYSYVVRGKILYFERPVGSTEIPEPRVFTARQQFFTPPNREHAMLFAEDTDFITMARNVRLHEQHEEDVVRMPFITPELAVQFLGPRYCKTHGGLDLPSGDRRCPACKPEAPTIDGMSVTIEDDDGDPG